MTKKPLAKIEITKVEGEHCDYCDELVAKKTLKEYQGDMICRECFKPTCMYCNESVEEEGDFCCEDCIKGFKYDNREK